MDDQHFCKPLEARRKSFVADDYSIQSTNDDASECKASAVNLGYWSDQYLKYFVKSPERRPPEIHRGYYLRVQIVRDLVDRFLKAFGSSAQIVNLGAGFDTLYWRLVEEAAPFKKFVELDFSSVTAKKINHILRPNCPLKKLISTNESEIRQSGHRDLFGPRYCLLGADIRDINELDDRLKLVEDLDTNLPTLFISECVLIYMSSEESTNLCSYLSSKFPCACFINYELVNLRDTFGEVFKRNMTFRGLTLAGVNICNSLQSQNERFLKAKWTKVNSYLMTDVYDKYIDVKDRNRIQHIEFLDETELLTQLLSHYCIVIALNDDSNGDLNKMML